MKRKNPLSENATKGDLLLLKNDLENKLNDLEQKIDRKAQGYRDEILTSDEKLARQLETIGEELEIGNFQTEEKIKDHEKRISHMEKIQQTA